MTRDQISVEAEPQVVEYLRALDIALARLPRDDAAELRQQIVEHLDESVGANASDQQIAEVLDRLGRPEELVAESLGAKPRRWWPRVRAWSWHRWAIVALVVAVLGSGIGYVVNMAVQPALQSSCQPCGWYYQRDSAHEHDIDNLTGDEMTAPDRPGQLQGLVFTIDNTSRWPETVLGVASRSDIGVGNSHAPTIAVGTANAALTGLYRSTRYVVAPAVVPPGQVRFLRVTWRSEHCNLAKGATVGTDTFGIRVRIGWFTHVQDLQIPETFALVGVARPNCPHD
jgi:hypothetical protein